jgi:hypothetical protein
MTTEPPKMLNGYPVIERQRLDDETWVICCWREGHSVHPYVVAKWSIHSPTEWLQGFYYSHLVAAGRSFSDMVGSA